MPAVSRLAAALRILAACLAPGCAMAAEAAADAAAPASPAGPVPPAFSMSGYLQAIGTLFALVVVLCVAVWLIRRYGRFSFLPRPGALPKGSLVMEAQLPLGPRRGLMVVRFLNRRVLLGVTDQQISLLTEEPVHHDSACPSHERDAGGFQAVLDRAADEAGDGVGDSRPRDPSA
ncbi:MAG: flagellar biosynthetic protein FliO [Desulfovibrio sp.]|nr:flagellar biosynthetic protein FliO [Desulfovibrio sp.]